MSEAYVYDGDVYCEWHAPEGSIPHSGESDTPEHCAECQEYLGVDLTSDGVDYVMEKLREEVKSGAKNYLEVHPCYNGGDYEGSPHYAIVKDWVDDCLWMDEYASRLIRWMDYQYSKGGQMTGKP